MSDTGKCDHCGRGPNAGFEHNNEGGPAFPRHFTERQNGLSVRQLYKAHAMQAIMELTIKQALVEKEYDYPKKAADACGVYADAMIREDEEFRLKQQIGKERSE